MAQLVTSTDISLARQPSDSVSELAWAPTSNQLALSSWDGKILVYDLGHNQAGTVKTIFDFGAPILGCHWSPDGNLVVGACTDSTAHVFDVRVNPASGPNLLTTAAPPTYNTSSDTKVGVHTGPVRSARFMKLPSTGHTMLVTGSWDSTVQYWDLRRSGSVGSLDVGGRVWAMDVRKDYLAVATSDGSLSTVNLNRPATILDRKRSPLRHQVRTIAVFYDGSGFAYGSIEGKAGWLWRSPSKVLENATFKCHRQTLNVAPAKGDAAVYAIGAISTHPHLHVFSTGGSDGSFHFWDPATKSRLKAFNRVGGLGTLTDEVLPVTATAFSLDARLFAYAVGYDWSKGFAFSRQHPAPLVRIHRVGTDCNLNQKK